MLLSSSTSTGVDPWLVAGHGCKNQMQCEPTDAMPTMPVTIDVSCVVYVSINCSVENRDNGNVVPRRTMPSAAG